MEKGTFQSGYNIGSTLRHIHLIHATLQYTHTRACAGIHECSVKNGGCGGTDALCLVTDGIKSVCECPATMAKQSSQSLATGLTTDTCISKLIL